jgi:7-carboxy-7-deazaguanine synthase
LVKEIFYTLQGEGANAGRPAVFVRFSGCNLWSGKEEDRHEAACTFCDTDFVGTDGANGGEYADPVHLAELATHLLPPGRLTGVHPLVVCTGGEPLLQVDEPLLAALHTIGFEVALETNGTITPPAGIDWICVSPKAGAPLKVTKGDELKLVFPQTGAEPERYEGLDFTYLFLQPMDDPMREQNRTLAVKYCMEHPQWRLRLQAHKLLGIP